ncbi:MAG: 16S rRNA (cytosine(1402)-N(4))-methyltransferase RsmH [Mycoplasmoidaceae bacterium]|nr:16S rRNA (cytosine(1402)-N(4))-methyltransferase RsmH [Mycoplasmoidaceae bacterium]
MKLHQSRIHTPVLLNEVIAGLNIKPNGLYVDATAGFGGHSQEILSKLDQGKLICIDQDINAINALHNLFDDDKRVNIIHGNFANLNKLVANKVDGIVLDLGVSSLMFDDPKRGFSYKLDGPLDMRMNNQGRDAQYIVNNYTRTQLIELFKKYGEVTNPTKVVDAIVHYREEEPIKTTIELANIIADCCPGSKIRKHPAKIYFQALRIEVNNELEVLAKGLEKAIALLNKTGRLCVITFHSLEDRIVKNYFRNLSQPKDLYGKAAPISKITKPQFKLITKKPIIPSQSEIETNRRSHSAKLRILEKI